MSYITSALPTLDLEQSSATGKFGATGDSGHLLSIIARMLKDPRLDPGKHHLSNPDIGVGFKSVLSQSGEIIQGYVNEWDLRLSGDAASDAATLDAKVEEIFWAHVLIFGVGGWSEKGFLADFIK